MNAHVTIGIAAPTRPLLRYHGGKWKLAPWIISHFPQHRVYVEPFGGGGSVLLRKPRAYAEVYNDLDGEIVNLFRVVRDRGDELRELLALTPFARDEYLGAFDLSDDRLECARRTVIRSFMGFGSNAILRTVKSGFRSNSNRSGTTPAHDWANYPDCLDALIQRLRGVVIENRAANKIMPQHDGSETLHYCDPPYVHETRTQISHGHHGYNHEMTDDDHRRFADDVRALSGMVVVSGYAHDLYDRELFADWARVERPAMADGARPRIEVLWLNDKCAAALSAQKGQQRLIA